MCLISIVEVCCVQLVGFCVVSGVQCHELHKSHGAPKLHEFQHKLAKRLLHPFIGTSLKHILREN